MNRNYLILTFIILSGLLLRLVVSPHYTHSNDLGLWIFWASEISSLGFKDFFSNINWTDYLPFYFYILFILNFIFQSFHDLIVFKLPGIIADLGTGIFIFLILNKFNVKHALIYTSFYIFNPAIFANSAMWGQVDGLGALLVVASIYFFSTQKLILLALTLAIAFLFKPLYLISIPILFIAQAKINFKKIPILLIYLILWSFLITLPFTQNILSVPELIVSRYTSSLGQYAYASVNAFNFWALLDKNWVTDTSIFLDLSYHTWGLLIFISVYTLATFLLLFLKISNLNLFVLNLSLVLTIAYIAIFTFATRVHERHLLTVFPLLLIASIKNSHYLFIYFILSFIYLLNLYFGIQFLYTNGEFVFDTIQVQLLSFFTVAFAIYIIISFLKQAKLDQDIIPKTLAYFSSIFNRLLHFNKARTPKIEKIDPSIESFSLTSSKFTTKKLLIILLIFSFTIRAFQLNNPNAYVFDEVYHAFTAKEYLKGSKEAWEWWTTPPPGVAYEWTHPPLAKELMTASMFITNSTDAWGWRLFGVIFGTINILLVFLLAKNLFKDEPLALASAYIYSFDGLSFVQARTGMNDTYLVTFVLLTLIAFVKKRYFFSAIFFGLALSSKWAAIYLLPVIALLLIFREQYYLSLLNLKPKLFLIDLFRFLKVFILYIFIPPLIYLLTYIPFFLTNHNFDTLVELQKQMWWYHTNLKATHDYASPWWSWPLNFYPVWYFVSYTENSVANIFASGNPVVFWIGFVAVLIGIWDFIKNKSFGLLVILLGYFCFFLPWAFSPRIMFLYHYTPSLPFLSIILAYQLNQINTTKTGRKIFTLILILIGVSFLLLYPFLAAVPVHKTLVNLFFLTNITKDPFSY